MDQTCYNFSFSKIVNHISWEALWFQKHWKVETMIRESSNTNHHFLSHPKKYYKLLLYCMYFFIFILKRQLDREAYILYDVSFIFLWFFFLFSPTFRKKKIYLFRFFRISTFSKLPKINFGMKQKCKNLCVIFRTLKTQISPFFFRLRLCKRRSGMTRHHVARWILTRILYTMLSSKFVVSVGESAFEY